jgi:hypothetical protein
MGAGARFRRRFLSLTGGGNSLRRPWHATERKREPPLSILATSLRDRLMAGRLALDQEIGVRVPVPQPQVKPRTTGLSSLRQP